MPVPRVRDLLVSLSHGAYDRDISVSINARLCGVSFRSIWRTSLAERIQLNTKNIGGSSTTLGILIGGAKKDIVTGDTHRKTNPESIDE